MSTSNTAQAATEFIEQVWNAPDGVDHLKSWLSPHYRDHAYSDDALGLTNAIIELKAAFADATFIVEDVLSQADSAVLRMTLRGTLSGTFRGCLPTGRNVEVKVYRWLRFEDGKVAEHWALLDTASLLRQLNS